MAGAYFFPYSPKVIEHAADQVVDRGPEGLTLSLKPGYDFVGGGTAPTEMAGVIATQAGAWEITATPGEPPAVAGASGVVESLFDFDRMLIETRRAEGSILYGYDAFGRRASTVDPLFSALFGYNAADQLVSLVTEIAAHYEIDPEGLGLVGNDLDAPTLHHWTVTVRVS